jgi:hypothetical protein|tara:strand:+ start:141 stop:521 length:381 start_codon:yes stop_codon:yes gene_type:complete
VRRVGDVLAWPDAESIGNLRDFVLSLVNGLLVRVYLEAEDATAPRASADVGGDAALRDEVAVDLGGAARGLAERGVGAEDVVVEDLTALGAASAGGKAGRGRALSGKSAGSDNYATTGESLRRGCA